MITSTLARKVFDQTDFEVNMMNAWWIELKLQRMQINGLVKMIQNSKRKELSYIEGYLPKYKWSFRKDSIVISAHSWLYEVLQGLTSDFSWGEWPNLIQIDCRHMDIMIEAVHIARNSGKGVLPYAMAIFKSKVQEIDIRTQEMKQQRLESQEAGQRPIKEMTENTANEWDSIKDLI